MNCQKTIFIAPLDWGLGHATRCMPLIDLLLKKGHRVIVGGNGDSFFLLKEQYPQLKFYGLPGYNISYPAGKNAAAASLLQAPKILQTIKSENKALEKILENEKIDLIISDNRYGVRNEKVKSIFICHHIAMQAPHHLRFMNPVFLQLHLQQINKFDALWIPDEEGDDNLSGKLSHNISFKIPHAYIGIQSRFYNFNKAHSFIDELDFSILAVLSGPEPQRSFLQQELKRKLSELPQNVLLIEGRTEKQTRNTDGNITTISYLNTNDLFNALQKADVIICRSGYSTVMDMAVLGKKVICIPAQGQTEQEYLANTLSAKNFAVACEQDNLDLNSAIKKLESIPGFPPHKSSTDKVEMELNKYLT